MMCNYKLTEAEIVSAMQLNGRGSKNMLIVLVMVCVALVLVGIFTEYKLISFGSAIGSLVGYFLILFILIPFRAKRQYRQHRALRNETTMLLSEQGINFKSESGENKLQWCDIHKWGYGNGIYLLYITSNMFYIVPARALSNTSELNTLLEKNIGPKKAL